MVRKLKYVDYVFSLVILLNLVNSCLQVAVGYSPMRILYSFTYMALFIPLSFKIFYLGYKNIMDPASDNIKSYKLL